MIPLKDYIEYDPESGRVLSNCRCDLDTYVRRPPGNYLDGRANAETQYVVDGALVERPEIAETVSKGTRVIVWHEAEGTIVDTVTERDDVLDFDLPFLGRYSIRYEPPFPFKHKQETRYVDDLS